MLYCVRRIHLIELSYRLVKKCFDIIFVLVIFLFFTMFYNFRFELRLSIFLIFLKTNCFEIRFFFLPPLIEMSGSASVCDLYVRQTESVLISARERRLLSVRTIVEILTYIPKYRIDSYRRLWEVKLFYPIKC